MKPTIHIEEQGIARLSGELTIRYHMDVMTILQALPHEQLKTMIIDSPETIDLSCLQLLLSYKRHRSQSAHPLEILFVLQETDRNLLERSGFEGLFQTKKSNA